MQYAIQFNFPEGDTLYAGMHQGAFGWAPTLATALLYDEREDAERVAANAYGPNHAACAKIIEVPIA